MGLVAKAPVPSLAWQEGAPLSRDPGGQLAGDPGRPKTGGLSPTPELCKPPHASLWCDRNDARRRFPRSPSNLVFVPPMPIQVRAVGASWTLLTPRWVCPASPHTHLQGCWAASAWPLAHVQTSHFRNTPKASSTPDFLPASSPPRPLLTCGPPIPAGGSPFLRFKPRTLQPSFTGMVPSSPGPRSAGPPSETFQVCLDPPTPQHLDLSVFLIPCRMASPAGPPRLPEATPPDTITWGLGSHTGIWEDTHILSTGSALASPTSLPQMGFFSPHPHMFGLRGGETGDGPRGN